jgi:hypothetical protein
MTVSSVNTPLQGIRYANDVNQDNPFEDNQQNKIETRINTFLGNNIVNEDFAYFARASETVRVTINILNPDSYVILSFNLNGRRYQSFEFREGSNSTRLLMDVILSPNVGLQELTLDEIKYIDGTEIKDAILFGEKTVRVGVLYPNLPEVSVTEKTIGKTSLELDIKVTDVNGLITNAPKPLYAFFYDGKTLKQQELTIGQNTIVFDKLKSQTVYQYAIATIFDRLDGSGNAVRLFTKEAISTNKFLAMSLTTTKTSLSFDITAEDSDSVGEITKVTLLKNNTIVQELLGQTEGTFSNLLTNNTYVVKTHFSYQFDEAGEVFEETEEQTGVTEANLIPVFSFTDVVPDQEDIVFEYTVTDTDAVGSLTKIELLKGTTVVETLTDFDATTFEGLLSNNDYQIKATYTYDLNDGAGIKTAVVTSNTKTLAKATPVFSFTDVVPDQEDIVFEYTVTDTDAVGSLTKIELLKGTTVVETLTDFDATTFEGLLSNNDYQIKATYTYDLNDGAGIKTAVVTSNTKTLAKATPTYTIFDTSSTSSSVSFDIDVLDSNGIGDITKIELYRDTTLIDSFDLINEEWPKLFLFEELTATNLYTINVTFSYDLNDGIGIQSQTVTKSIRTMALPISITNVVVLNSTLPKVGEEVTLRVSFNNPSKVVLSSLTIDNKVVNITGGDLINFAILSYVPNTQGGVHEVSIGGLSYTQSSDVFTQSIPTPYLKEIKVLGSVIVERIYNENDNIVAQDMTNNYFLIDVKNPTNYTITSLSLRINWSSEIVYLANEIEMMNNNRIRVPHKGSSYSFSLSNQNVSLTKLTFGLEDIGYSEIEVKDVSNNFMFLKTLTPRSINTIDQFKNMENGYIYELNGNLNLENETWSPKNFYGVLNGKGYKISNLTQVIVTDKTELQIGGLFKNFSGLMKNVSFENFYIYIKSKGGAEISAIAGLSNVSEYVNISVKNIILEGDSPYVGVNGVIYGGTIINSVIQDVSITANSPNQSMNANGIFGYGELKNSIVKNVSISVNAKGANIGGVGNGNIKESIVRKVRILYNETRPVQEDYPYSYEMNIGGMLSSGGVVSNSIVDDVVITATSIINRMRIGGITGIYGDINKVLISNVTINANSGQQGGGIGYLYTSRIANSLAINIIKANGSTYGVNSGGNIVNHVNNNYASFNSPIQNNTNSIASLEQLNSSDFYITTLGWDNAIWNFDNLDYANGIYPTLINIPQQQ